MSNWPIFPSCKLETLGEASGDGTNITLGNGSKGSYATLGTTGFAYAGFFLMLMQGTNGTQLFDVAFGASNTIIIPDLSMGQGNAGSNAAGEWIHFPVGVQSGVALKIAGMGNGAAQTARAVVIGYAQETRGVPPASKVIAINAFTSTAPTNSTAFSGTAGTNNAGGFIEFTASLAEPIVGLYVAQNSAGDVARTTATRFAVDIAMGAASSEIVRCTLLGKQISGGTQNPIFGPIPIALPAATRLSWRTRANTTATDSISFAAYGLVA